MIYFFPHPRAILGLLALMLLVCGSSLAQESDDRASAPSGSTADDSSDADLNPVARLAKFYWDSATEAMASELQRLDNYSCVHHISRYQWAPGARGYQVIDTVRLQVSYLGGKEYFGRLGSPYMVSNPREIVGSGMLGSGFFRGFVSNIFVSQAVETLIFRGVQEGPEQEFFRYQYNTHATNPIEVEVGGRRQSVPGKGELWLDKNDRRLRRIVVENSAPLRSLGLRRVINIMDWAPVSTSYGDVLLPQRADLWMVSMDGTIDRNEVTLAQCREYRAESSIRFDGDDDDDEQVEEIPITEENGDDPNANLVSFAGLAADGATGGAGTGGVSITASRLLPGGLSLSIELRQPLSLEGLRVGETFVATVVMDVVQQGRTLVPAGTNVEGRVRRLDRYRLPVPHTVLWLEFPVVRHEGEEYTFLADVVRMSNHPELANRNAIFQYQRSEKDPSSIHYLTLQGPEPGYKPVAGIASYVFRDEPESLPAGHRIEWKTIKVD